MYGFKDEQTAYQKAEELQQNDPINRYLVAIHKHPETNIWGQGDKTVTYGVQRLVPYIPDCPWKLDGFVWFE